MHEAGALPLVVESPVGRSNLVVDSILRLEVLLPALLAATGVRLPDGPQPGVAAPPQTWQLWEGQRLLDVSRSLTDLGVVAGSKITLCLSSAAAGRAAKCQ